MLWIGEPARAGSIAGAKLVRVSIVVVLSIDAVARARGVVQAERRFISVEQVGITRRSPSLGFENRYACALEWEATNTRYDAARYGRAADATQGVHDFKFCLGHITHIR